MNDYHKSTLEHLSIEHNFCSRNLTFLLLWSEFKVTESIDSCWSPVTIVYVCIIIIIIVVVQELYIKFRPLFFHVKILSAFTLFDSEQRSNYSYVEIG